MGGVDARVAAGSSVLFEARAVANCAALPAETASFGWITAIARTPLHFPVPRHTVSVCSIVLDTASSSPLFNFLFFVSLVSILVLFFFLLLLLLSGLSLLSL